MNFDRVVSQIKFSALTKKEIQNISKILIIGKKILQTIIITTATASSAPIRYKYGYKIGCLASNGDDLDWVQLVPVIRITTMCYMMHCERT